MVLPDIAAGVDGTPETTSDRAVPAPHALVAETDNVQVVKLAGQSIVTPLRLVGPTIVPQELVQLYPVASAIGVMEYETPVCPH